jgi:hypothetical protein
MAGILIGASPASGPPTITTWRFSIASNLALPTERTRSMVWPSAHVYYEREFLTYTAGRRRRPSCSAMATLRHVNP